MNLAAAETLSASLLVLVLGFAVIRPRDLPEAVMAVPAAGLALITGAISLRHARAEVGQLVSVVIFLGAVLLLAQLCDDEGLFQACGGWIARGARGRPKALLGYVFALSCAVTAVLSLDATVVLLTPVIFATAARSGVRPRPHVYACTHLSNTASVLLPVSNLTNLLALSVSGLSFGRFAALMTLPWVGAVAVEFIVFRIFFASDLDAGTRMLEPVDPPPVPVFAGMVVAATLAGFATSSLVGLSPAWPAVLGAGVLSVRALARRRATPVTLVRSISLPFLVFVLALGVVVRAVVDNGLGDALGHLLPEGTGILALLAVAVLAAVLANVINNLPAVLVLLPLTAAIGPGAVLAMLLGVNIGPNLTYAGSLATLLWRRIVQDHDVEVEVGEFTRLGLLTVPIGLCVAVPALWASLIVMGG